MPLVANVEVKQCVVCGGSFEVGGRGRPKRAQRFCSNLCSGRARYRTGRTANTLTDAEAAYIAGFIDADGSFIIHGRYDGSDSLAFRVSAGGTKASVFHWMAGVTGVGVVSKARRSQNPRHRDYYQWHANGDAAVSLARQLAPYLVLKREQCELGIAFQERLRTPALKADRAWQQEWRLRMRDLNARGNPEGVTA